MVLSSGNLTVTGTITTNGGTNDGVDMIGTSPTIMFKDTDNRTGYWHMNSDIMYLLSGANGAGTAGWAQVGGQWPLMINTGTNAMTGGGTFTLPGYVSITGVQDTLGNLRFSAANPYISASSYFIAPGGAYFNSLTVYTEAELKARGGIADDGGNLVLNDAVDITGALTIGTDLAVVYGGTGVSTSTGTGNVVLSASPSFTGTADFDTISFVGISIVMGGGSPCGQTSALCWDVAGDTTHRFGSAGAAVFQGALTQNTNPDFAENINVLDQSIEAGDIVVSTIDQETYYQEFGRNIDPQYHRAVASKSGEEYAVGIIGAISTDPGVLLNSRLIDRPDEQRWEEYERPLTVAGRIPLKVTEINGHIKPGDSITSSKIPGVGMKSTKAGRIVGTALEEFDSSSATQAARLINGEWQTTNSTCSQNEPNCYNQTKILVLIQVGWNDPDVYITSTGDFAIKMATPSAEFNIPSYFTLNDVLGNPIDRIGAFKELVVANVKAGFIDAQQISTNALSVTTENITINGQNIRDYIAAIVSDILNNTNSNLISPIASVDQIHTNLINPVSPTSSVALKLENDRISILNGNSSNSATVTSFDNKGNATLSGSLAVNLDATIGGTLRASRIIADQIEGLNIKASTVSANYITNNYYNSSNSAFPTLIATPSNVSSASSSLFEGLFSSNNFINIATYSSELAYVENLNGANAAFSQSLTVFGSTTLSDTSVVGQLSVNGSLILASNSINVLGSDLNLQPLRQGGLSVMAGLFYIDTNGNVTTQGDATIKGTLYANTISPIPGSDLAINLGSISGFINPSLMVNNASGAALLTINQKGDLVASGTATFGKLNIGGLIAPALAVSPTEVIATGSAGTGVINTGRTQMTINNVLVSDKSLIYITPTSTTTQTIFLLRQVSGESFTVGIQNPSLTPIKFNWIIVN
jgi:hypothetical protein